MAYFRCGQGAGGNELKILITTTDTSLYGQTITISKDGSTVGTTTFDNQGEAEYTVEEVGQYTVSCGGYSATVDVSDEFPVEIITNIVATVTLYSAANDTVTFTDATGQKTANTDTNGVATNVVITVSRDTPTVLFTSGVAKNPDNLTEYYSKSVTITDSTTKVYVMPNDNVLYWYGYNDLEDVIAANGWTSESSYYLDTPPLFVLNTNFIRTGGSAVYHYYSAMGSKEPKRCRYIKYVIKTIGSASYRCPPTAVTTKQFVSPNDVYDSTSYSTPTLLTVDMGSENDYYVTISDTGMNNYYRVDYLALWYE